VATGCGSATDDPVVAESDPTAIAEVEPTLEPPAPPAPMSSAVATPEPAATPEPTATPEPIVLAVDDRAGAFECANQEPGVVRTDPELDAELEALVGDGVPGLVAASVSSDGVLRIGVAGERSTNGDDPMLATDRMHLGSGSGLGMVVSGRNIAFKPFDGGATVELHVQSPKSEAAGFNDLTTDVEGRIYVGELGASPFSAAQ